MGWERLAGSSNNVYPPPRIEHAIAYDSARARIVLFGGRCHQPSMRFSNTWEYGGVSPLLSFGDGCAGADGTPALVPAPNSLPWLGSTLEMQVGSLPATDMKQVFGVIGLSNSSWLGAALPLDLAPLGFPGCQQHISMDASVTLPNVGTSVPWNLSIPNDPSLACLEFFLQVAVLDLRPASQMPPAPISLAVSNASRGVLGLK